MKKNNIFPIFSSLCLLALTCCKPNTEAYRNRNPQYQQKTLKDSLSLLPTATYILQVDSLCNPNTESGQTFTLDGKDFLAYLNADKKSIDVYDIQQQKKAFSFDFTTLVEAQKVQLNYAYVHNLDSIFLFSQKTGKLLLTNSTASRLRTFETHSKNPEDAMPEFNPTFSNPMVFYKGSIILSGWSYGDLPRKYDKSRPISYRLDLRTSKGSYFNTYPNFYDHKNWGGIDYRIPYTDGSQEQLITSLPADHYLSINPFASPTTTLRKYAGSRHVPEIVSMDSEFTEDDDKPMYKHFYTQYSYRNIIYDRYRKVYYRIVQLPELEENLRPSGTGNKRISIIILDQNFNILGESFIPKSNSYWTYFVSKDGLNLLDYEKSTEDTALFNVFTLAGK